jgi:hypothetical protein
MKPLDEYYRRSDSGKYRTECKVCRVAQTHTWRARNLEHCHARDRAYHHAHKEERNARQLEYCTRHRKYLREYHREHYKKIRRRKLEYLRKWRDANRDVIIKHNRTWRLNNSFHSSVLDSRKRAARRNAKGTFDHRDISRIWHWQHGNCFWCGVKCGSSPSDTSTYHIDHITPVSKGGSNWPRNLCIACPPCNISKGDKYPSEFRAYLMTASR